MPCPGRRQVAPFSEEQSCLIGRLSYGIVSLSLLLTLTAGGRDYGLAGLVLALFSLTVVLVSPLRARMVAGLAVLLIPAALSPNLLVLALLIGPAGALVAPAYATANVLAADLASPQARTRAGNWVSSGYNAGGSAGAALAGQLVGRVPLGACLPLLAGPALLAIVPLLRARLANHQNQVTPHRLA